MQIESLRRFGDEPIRIEWYGNVFYVGNTGGRIPRISIVVSQATSRGRILKNASVAAGFLHAVRIGDYWESGRFIAPSNDSVRECFRELEIRKEHGYVVGVGVPIDPDAQEREFPLPFALFDAHQSHTGTNCLRMRLGQDSMMIVPCMELIRFYFGSSGMLLARILASANGVDGLFTHANLNPISKVANLTLASGVSGFAATTIARVAFDTTAASALRWIASSGTSAAANKRPYYPKTKFPFIGKSDLTADGRWLVHGSKRTFLVERLVQCTHPFPFEKLIYETSQEATGDESGRTQSTASKRSFNSKNTIGVEDLVDPGLTPMALTFKEAEVDAFPDLANKSVLRIKAVSAGSQAAIATGQIGTGEASSAGSLRGIEMVGAPLSKLPTMEPNAVEVFRKAFSALPETLREKVRLARPPAWFWHFEPENLLLPSVFQPLIVSGTTIWMASIQIVKSDPNRCLLVLVRDNEAPPLVKQIIVLRLLHQPDMDGFSLEAVSVSFAHDLAHTLSEDLVVIALDSNECGCSESVGKVLEGALDNEVSQVDLSVRRSARCSPIKH